MTERTADTMRGQRTAETVRDGPRTAEAVRDGPRTAEAVRDGPRTAVRLGAGGMPGEPRRRLLSARHFPAGLLSLGNRIALVFFAITLVAIATLYMIVVPGLQSRLLGTQMRDVSRSRIYSAPISDVIHNVHTVRHDILVGGAIALALAWIGGYLTARWLAQRVKRLERAAERVAAGEFEHPIPVDSRDELGQLAVAFNDMQRQLSQLESARKKFIATASHELRTPIFSLGGFVELLEDEELDAQTRRRFLDQVSEQVERLRKLSVDLLDLSRLESGSLELRPEEVDFGELTRSVTAEFEPSLGQHDSLLELNVPAALEAQCDPVRIAQIVRILIDNALTHTAPGTDIAVTAARQNGSVSLAVRDNGQGIEGSALSRIFEPFYTADGAKGSGLGLAIASELAERMHGRLTVFSTPGQTVFTLEIPG